MKAHKILILSAIISLAACKSDSQNLTEEEKKEMETVTDQIRRDSLRADSAFKAMQKRINDAKLDTGVKLVEPPRQ